MARGRVKEGEAVAEELTGGCEGNDFISKAYLRPVREVDGTLYSITYSGKAAGSLNNTKIEGFCISFTTDS